jgi:phage N-6-adenine-methyltransferase
MTLGGVHFSTGTDSWGTPHEFFDRLNRDYKFTLDACAEAWNAKCNRFYTAEDDGLEQPWESWTWCNPPYSDILSWYRKAYEEMLLGNSSVLLTFARTDTRAFHRFASKSTKIVFIEGRLRFLDPATRSPKAPAPSPSMLVVFDAERIGERVYGTMNARKL